MVYDGIINAFFFNDQVILKCFFTTRTRSISTYEPSVQGKIKEKLQKLCIEYFCILVDSKYNLPPNLNQFMRNRRNGYKKYFKSLKLSSKVCVKY